LYACKVEKKREENKNNFGKSKFDQHFNNNLDRLQREFNTCKESFNLNSSNNYQPVSNNLTNNKNSNNLPIKNRTIDDYISSDSPEKKTNILGSKKFKYDRENQNIENTNFNIKYDANFSSQNTFKNNCEKESTPKASFDLRDVKYFSKKKKIIDDDDSYQIPSQQLEEKISNVKNIKIKNDKIPFIKKKDNTTKSKIFYDSDNEVEEDLLKSVLEKSKFEK